MGIANVALSYGGHKGASTTDTGVALAADDASCDVAGAVGAYLIDADLDVLALLGASKDDAFGASIPVAVAYRGS